MDIQHLIAAINPDVYCAPKERREVKRILKEAAARGEPDFYLNTAGKTIPAEPNEGAIDELELENPFRLPGFKGPTERHTLVYDNFDESLESLYFWLLDELETDGWEVSKLSDTFTATVGSGLYADLTRRETRVQQEALKMLRDAQYLIRDILRDTTRLKEMSETTAKEEAEDKSLSRSREVERHVLKSMVETLNLYARWLGPYLRQARQLDQRATGGAALVHLFNTAAAEVVLLAQREYPVSEDVDRGDLPRFCLKASQREYASVLLIELKLRAAPERNQTGGYGYRGRFELTMTSYGLNYDELATLRREIERDNLEEMIGATGGISVGLLNDLVQTVERLMAEPKDETKQPDDPNPILALFDFRMLRDEKREDAPNAVVQKDSEVEEVIRSQAILEARRRCLEWYGRIKRSLNMPVFE